MNATGPHSRFIILGVLALGAVIHGIPATRLGLYWDDPEMLMQPYQALAYRPLAFVFADTLNSLPSERPVSYLPYTLMRAAFVHSVALVHWVHIALFALTAIVLTHVTRLVVAPPWFHFAAAITFLLYPLASLDAIWPSTAHYLTASLFAFGTILAAVRAARETGRRRVIGLGQATASYAACILTHEVFVLMPLAFLGAYFLTAHRPIPIRPGTRRLSHVLMPIVVTTGPLVLTLAAYALWRLTLLPAYSGPLYPATDIIFSPAVVLRKIISGSLMAIFPWTHVVTFTWFARPGPGWVIAAVGAGATTWAITTALMRPADAAQPAAEGGPDGDERQYHRAALIGLAMVAAATTAIAVAPVTVRATFGASSFGGRVNLVVVLGVALLLPALIAIVARRFWRPGGVMPVLVFAGIVTGSLVTDRVLRSLLAQTLLSPASVWTYSPAKKVATICLFLALLVVVASVLVPLARTFRSGVGRWAPSPALISRRREARLVATALAALVFVSCLLHVSAKNAFVTEWVHHKAVMEGLRSVAPQLKDDTFVVIVREDPARSGETYSPPFSDHSELSSYMPALYDNNTILANVHFRLWFSGDGFFTESYVGREARWFPPGVRGPTRTHATVPVGRLPYDRVVMFRYDGQSVTLLPRLAVVTDEGHELTVRSNTERIVASVRPITTRIWRHIAQ